MVSGPFYFVLWTCDMLGKKLIEKYPFKVKRNIILKNVESEYFHTISNFAWACFQHKT